MTVSGLVHLSSLLRDTLSSLQHVCTQTYLPCSPYLPLWSVQGCFCALSTRWFLTALTPLTKARADGDLCTWCVSVALLIVGLYRLNESPSWDSNCTPVSRSGVLNTEAPGPVRVSREEPWRWSEVWRTSPWRQGETPGVVQLQEELALGRLCSALRSLLKRRDRGLFYAGK